MCENPAVIGDYYPSTADIDDYNDALRKIEDLEAEIDILEDIEEEFDNFKQRIESIKQVYMDGRGCDDPYVAYAIVNLLNEILREGD